VNRALGLSLDGVPTVDVYFVQRHADVDAAQKKSTSELDEAVVKECGGPTGAGGMTVLGVTKVPEFCIPDKALRF